MNRAFYMGELIDQVVDRDLFAVHDHYASGEQLVARRIDWCH
jgi:hypothetical protein